MPNSNGSSTNSAKLEDLVALNEEIIALVRAGVPLEMGLEQVGRDLRGSLGRLAAELGSRMSSGASLSEAMEAEGSHFPKMYRAVVEAGLKAGRLPTALEAITRHAQSLIDVHRRVTLACAYPLIVCTAAYGLFLVLLSEIIPRFEALFENSGSAPGLSIRFLRTLAETMPVWGAVLPLLLLFVIGYWVFFQKRRMLRTGRSAVLFRMIPWAGGIFRDLQFASFSDLLGLLTSHEVPLHRAILFAADSTGNRGLMQSAEAISVKLQCGETLGESMQQSTAFPAYLRWLMSSGEKQGRLSQALVEGAAVYRARALAKLESLKIALPLLVVSVIGGGATLIYALTLFTPLAESFRNLGGP